MSATRKPCPQHPDRGDVNWYEIRAPRHGGGWVTGAIPSCAACLAGPDPADFVEVDNPFRREVRPRRGTENA